FFAGTRTSQPTPGIARPTIKNAGASLMPSYPITSQGLRRNRYGPNRLFLEERFHSPCVSILLRLAHLINGPRAGVREEKALDGAGSACRPAADLRRHGL